MTNDFQAARSASIYFYAGDFVDVLRRHAAGEQQIYATHDEVAKLILDLRSVGVKVTVYSFLTPTRDDRTPMEGVRIVALGGIGNQRGVLAAAVEEDDSDVIIAHFAYPELLNAALRSGKQVYAGLANSYNERGPRHFVRRFRIARLLNDRRISMVTNHCLPSTEHLAKIGVARRKLVPWDVPHRFKPHDYEAKTVGGRDIYKIAYAGSIAELKGVGDLIRAMGLLRREGVELQAALAGLGDIDAMSNLAEQVGVADRVNFRGIVGNSDVFAMFRDADLVVVPSRSAYPEGFPLTMFEAIASRSPIICSDHPMFRPIMKDGVNSAVFRSGDVAGFAAAISRVLRDPTLYKDLSESAVRTWATLQGPADWRTLLTKWVVEGPDSPWVRQRSLQGRTRTRRNSPGSAAGAFSINSKYMD